jgi:pimeloyl-ACP methyl ester carboxylesterase
VSPETCLTDSDGALGHNRAMPTSAAWNASAAAISHHDILSDDGTHVRAWTNDPHGRIDGPTVVLCNGLGTNPYMWPALLRRDCQVRVVSWYHRGVGGSERPRDRRHVEIQHFVEDGVSVMDHFGIDSAVLMGWSMGVNTMFELAVRYPERVAGLFAVCGVPGDTFRTMLAPFRLPHPVARAIIVNFSRAMSLGGWALTPVTQRIPIGPRAIDLLSRTRFTGPIPDKHLAAVALNEFRKTPVQWYFHLALSTSRHARVSLSKVRVPAAFVAADRDILAGARDMRTAAARMPGATYAELNGTHFLAIEQPGAVHAQLLEFLDKVEAGLVA